MKAIKNSFENRTENDFQLNLMKIRKMKKDIKDLEYFASTLEYDHQKSLKYELEMKINNLKTILNDLI